MILTVTLTKILAVTLTKILAVASQDTGGDEPRYWR